MLINKIIRKIAAEEGAVVLHEDILYGMLNDEVVDGHYIKSMSFMLRKEKDGKIYIATVRHEHIDMLNEDIEVILHRKVSFSEISRFKERED